MRTSPFERSYTIDVDREATTRYLETLDAGQVVHPEIEDAFIRSVARYSVRLGLTTDAWRSLGVPKHVLRLAGMD